MPTRCVNAALASLGVALFGFPARATSQGESAYCRRVRAQVAGDAAILKWPRAVVEGLRFPSSSRIDLGPTVGNNFQARAGLAFSPVDFYRGTLLERVGNADCEEHEASTQLEELLGQVADAARLAALRAQGAYLESHRDEWRALVAKAVERFEARVITTIELQDVRRLAHTVERKVEEVRGEADRLAAARPPDGATPPLGELAATYVSRWEILDREMARMRALERWTFKITGGVIPLPGQPFDWYGLAEVSYSLGGFSHAAAQARYLQAHEDEIRQARYQLPARLARARREAQASLTQARRELVVVEAQLSSANATSRLLDGADAPGARHARDTLALERMSAESDRVFLRALVDALSSTLEGGHGS